MQTTQKDNKKEKQNILSDKNLIKEKIVLEILHRDNPELALDLIEWEDDGKGNFIPH